MKLPKAIEILSKDLTYTYPAMFTDLQDAIKLGIEALKRLQDMRAGNITIISILLPGETPLIDPSRSAHSIKKILESPLGIEPKG